MKKIIFILFLFISVASNAQWTIHGKTYSPTMSHSYGSHTYKDTIENELVVNGTAKIATLTIGGASPVTGTMTSGQVPYATGTNTVSSEAAFAYDATNDVLSVPRLTLGTNISAASWTTSGLRLRLTPVRLTNTTSSGTVSLLYNSFIAGDTLHASSSTTYTNAASLFIGQPIAGTNVTLSNPNFALAMNGGVIFPTAASIGFRSTGAGSMFFGTFGGTCMFINSSNNLYVGGATQATSTLQGGGSFALPYVAKTGTYTISATDHTIDCTSGTFTVTLPTAVSITGRIYTVSNTGAGTITLGTTSSQTINGSTTQTIAAGGGYSVQSNGANWTCVSKW